MSIQQCFRFKYVAYICSEAPWTSVQLFAFESLLLTLVSVCSCGCRSVNMCSSLALPPLALQSESAAWYRGERWDQASSRGHCQTQSWSWAATRCPRYPQLSTREPAASSLLHSLWEMLQLANLTSCLLCPSLPFLPLSAELNALFIPFMWVRFLCM